MRWQLTKTAFDGLLAALDPDQHSAGEKYVRLRGNLVRFFETRGLAAADEAADDVLNRLARKIESGGPLDNPGSYALGIARMVALELRRSPSYSSSDAIPEIGIPARDAELEETEGKLKCLGECLAELKTDNRQIIVGYYKGEKREKIENRNLMARNLGIPQNALRSRAVRLREKLEKCITDCVRRF